MSAVPWDLPLRGEVNARRRRLLPGAGGPAVRAGWGWGDPDGPCGAPRAVGKESSGPRL